MSSLGQQKLQELRAEGWEVRVSHRRPLQNPNGPSKKLLTRYELSELGLRPKSWSTKGGETEVTLVNGNGVVRQGISRCSAKDNFNRKLGLLIALGRAMSTKENGQLKGQFVQKYRQLDFDVDMQRMPPFKRYPGKEPQKTGPISG